jgi:hypothetical protein
MKTIYSITVLALFMCIVISCKKDVLLDGSKSIERANALEKELKTQLNNSKDGWILFISPLNANVKTSMPFIMKFDTLENKVSMTSMYGKDVPSYFNISAATGMPLLSFSTGSGLSAVYEVGSTNVTDYFFKVLKVSADTITMQPYRKGSSSASEGGAILKMVKNTQPAWIKDWQTESIKLYDQASFFGKYLTTQLTFASGEAFTTVRTAFIKFGAADITYLRANYPTSANNLQTTPMYFSYFPTTGGQTDPLSFMGYNSLYFDIYAAASTNALYGVNPATLQRLYKTNYFFIRKVNATSIDIFAIDKDGKEFVSGRISQ